MEIDGALVMEQFMGHMGNFFIVIGFCTLITLCLTSVYIYLVHHTRSDDWEEFE